MIARLQAWVCSESGYWVADRFWRGGRHRGAAALRNGLPGRIAMSARKPIRLVDAPKPAAPPPLRDLSESRVYLHNAAMRAAWASAIGWMRARPRGSIWLLDKQTERKDR